MLYFTNEELYEIELALSNRLYKISEPVNINKAPIISEAEIQNKQYKEMKSAIAKIKEEIQKRGMV